MHTDTHTDAHGRHVAGTPRIGPRFCGWGTEVLCWDAHRRTRQACGWYTEDWTEVFGVGGPRFCAGTHTDAHGGHVEGTPRIGPRFWVVGVPRFREGHRRSHTAGMRQAHRGFDRGFWGTHTAGRHRGLDRGFGVTRTAGMRQAHRGLDRGFMLGDRGFRGTNTAGVRQAHRGLDRGFMLGDRGFRGTNTAGMRQGTPWTEVLGWWRGAGRLVGERSTELPNVRQACYSMGNSFFFHSGVKDSKWPRHTM